jgi:hypothetical protein
MSQENGGVVGERGHINESVKRRESLVGHLDAFGV